MSLYVESKSDKRIRNTASVTVLILAISAGVLSYNALRELAIKAGIHPMLAFLFPITLDGLILAGSLLILYFAVRGKRSGYGLFLTGLGVIASIAGNVVISPDDLTYQILHATSPVVLFLALESLMILLRARSRNAQEAAEKERAERKLQDDGYFHHKTSQHASKGIEETPAEPVSPEPVRNPQALPKASQEVRVPQPIPTKHSPVVQVLQAEEIVPAVVVPSPVVEVVPTASTKEPELSQQQEAVSESVVSLGLGKHSSRPAPEKEEPAVQDFKSEVTESVLPQVAPVKEEIAPIASTVSTSEVQPPSKREIIRDLLIQDPEMEASVIVDMVGGDRKYVQKLIRAERAKLTES